MEDQEELFNKRVLSRMIAQSQNFHDLRDMIFIELINYARGELKRRASRSSVAAKLKINRTTLVEMLKRLQCWPKDNLLEEYQNLWSR